MFSFTGSRATAAVMVKQILQPQPQATTLQVGADITAPP